ncbi:MAG: hypothetical protein OXT69_10240 [Candidatus Poribacteria bacterium]|nr:hypothetical protein [Candidatus Poribacteria bacterium]
MRSIVRKAFIGTAVLILAAGCGSKELPPPDMTMSSKIAIAPFLSSFDPQFGMLTARDLGNRFQLHFEQVKEGYEVLFDQSEALQPITQSIVDLELTEEEIFANPALAGKVAENLGVDLLIVGRIGEPRITIKEDTTPVYDMSKAGGLSVADTKYFITWQRATMRIWLKAVNQQGEVVWQTGSTPPDEAKSFTGHIRYARAYQSAAPERPPVSEEQIMSDLREDAWMRIANRLLPEDFPKVVSPAWKEKPAAHHRFKSSGGFVEFR